MCRSLRSNWTNYCNYSRILGCEERKDRRPHEVHQSVEDIVVMKLGSFNDGGQCRVCMRAPFRAKPLRDLAMNDRGTQGPLTGIVVRRDVRTMQKDEQVLSMPSVPLLQPAGWARGH